MLPRLTEREMLKERENWIDVDGCIGRYQFSNKGRVKSLQRKLEFGRGYRHIEEKILKPNVSPDGYLYYVVKNNLGKSIVIKPHRLVAKAFVPNPLNLPEVNHLNGKDDNHAESLEWCDHKHNMKHAYKNDLIPAMKGINNGRSKLTEDDVRAIRKLKDSGLRQVDIGRMFNISQFKVSAIFRERAWTHVK